MIQKTRPLSIKKLKPYLLNIEILCLKKAAHAVILNENLKEFIFSKTNKPFKNTIINNAVNTSLIEKLKANKVSKKEDEMVFGYIGTLTAYEGLEFLIQTFQELYDDGFKHKLIIYGKGVNKQSVQDQIIARSDINTISYKGAIAPSEVYKAFSEIDVIINPRLNTPLTNSVTPLKPLEAMAYEKLFIGSDVGGIKEIVPQGTGFLFSSENKNDLKKVVKKVASLSPQDRNRHKKEALDFVVSHKSWLQNAAKYKEIYTTLCS